MTREEFIKVLKEKKYSYEIEGDKIVVTRGDEYGYVNLDALTTLPAGVKFENGGSVWLPSLTTLPAGVKFKNKGNVSLYALTTLPSDVKFENGGDVDLRALTTIPSDVKFENSLYVGLNSLVGDWFHQWKGNIEGIASKRLLNLMINKGLFQ